MLLVLMIMYTPQYPIWHAYIYPSNGPLANGNSGNSHSFQRAANGDPNEWVLNIYCHPCTFQRMFSIAKKPPSIA